MQLAFNANRNSKGKGYRQTLGYNNQIRPTYRWNIIHVFASPQDLTCKLRISDDLFRAVIYENIYN